MSEYASLVRSDHCVVYVVPVFSKGRENYNKTLAQCILKLYI